MDERLVFAGVLLVFVLFLGGVFALLVFDKTGDPVTYVSTAKREKESSMLLDTVVDRFPAKVEIAPLQIENNTIKVGVSADPNMLDFGVVAENMSVRKFFILKNDDRKVKLCVRAYGDLASMLNISEESFLMEQNESRELGLEFKAAGLGNYSGEVDVITKKTKYDFMEPLLPFVGC